MLTIHIFYFIIGACLASFACLCGQRCGQEKTPWQPKRSYCDYCQRVLRWWQLIPICGYLIQYGHCSFCRHRLSPFHPAIECLAGLFMFQTAGRNLPAAIIVAFAFSFIISSDFFYQMIYPLSLIGLIPLIALLPSWRMPTSTEALLAAIFIIFLFFFNYRFNSIGSGDIEFIALLFFLVGVENACVIIVCSCLIMIPCFSLSRQRQLPFLPALATITIIFVIF